MISTEASGDSKSNRVGQPSGAASDQSLYRRIWRWHFIAGVLLGPVIVIVAVSGGLYVFKGELERLWYADVLLVEPTLSEQPLDRLVDAALSLGGDGWQVDQIEIDADATHAWGIAMHSPAHAFRRLYINQYTGAIQGEVSEASFFPIVLDIHRSLFVGALGRIVVELATCWTIILLATGLYLWWPRQSKRNRATLKPRWRGPAYLKLRDLHAVAGFWAIPIAAVIAVTGLLYSFAWGSMFQLASLQTGAYDLYINPIQLAKAAEGATSWSSVREATRDLTQGMNHSIMPPPAADAAHLVIAGRPIGPSYAMALAVDGRTGEIVMRKSLGELPVLAQWGSWNYPLHTGSVLGWPTKVLWLVVSIVLTLLPVTGVWMWLARRPRGALGLPRAVDGRLRLGLKALLVLVCIMLPVAGLSVICAYGAETAFDRWARQRRGVELG